MLKESLKLSSMNSMFLKKQESSLPPNQPKNLHRIMLMTSTLKSISSLRTIYHQNTLSINLQFNSSKTSSTWSMQQKMKEFWRCHLWPCLNTRDLLVWPNRELERINPTKTNNSMILSTGKSFKRLQELVHRSFSMRKNAR